MVVPCEMELDDIVASAWRLMSRAPRPT
jgi:hypothetical protein